uniref:CUB and zona pellucida-like domain-containing protein 1 n=2 Tax=Petromyzon marinus TaxID=7757 RepID=A0AAJ7WXT1_PETMA|nr:CUB and zona pellucida-like domain-containing protein 1 [Petromyzon marinus]
MASARFRDVRWLLVCTILCDAAIRDTASIPPPPPTTVLVTTSTTEITTTPIMDYPNWCWMQPCLHGTCEPSFDYYYYRCICTPGWSGPNCENEIPDVYWTRWYDRDDPSGNGDYETLQQLRQEYPGEICLSPLAIEAMTLDWIPADQTGQVTVNGTTVGFYCVNIRQVDNQCLDYQVRFLCQATESPQLNCTSQYLELKIPLDKLSSLNLSPLDIHLEDASCRGVFTQQYLILHSDLQSCGTTAEAHGDTIVYSNTVYGFVSGTTAKKLRIPIHCSIDSQGNVVASYLPRVHDKYSSATFDLSMVLYMDQSFSHPIYSYPFEVDLGAPIYAEVLLNSPTNDLLLFLETCRASPFTGANDSDSYFIIRNGCQEDPSYVNYFSGDNKRQHFSFQSVEFSNGFQVYLECSVHICHISNRNSTCQRGCVRTKRSVRDLVSWEKRAERNVDLSQGPLRLRKSRQASGVLSSLAGMVYALAAALAVAAVCVAAVKVYRHRAAGPQYHHVVTNDEFAT